MDYVTGEICDLGSRAPQINLAGLSDIAREQNGIWPNGDVEWEFRQEDYDGDGQEDILLVTTFYRPGSGSIMLWLQRQGSFLPVNSAYCGNYTNWQQSLFSLEIEEQEGKFRNGKDQEAWSTDNVGAWIREELFAGRAEELEAALENPKRQLLYTQWREPIDIHVTLTENAQGQYRVHIPENSYGEGRINAWLQEFYEKQDDAEKEFMGLIRWDSETLSAQERWEAGFHYNLRVWPERVDDVVISLMNQVDSGFSGSRPSDTDTGAVTFDTRSGKALMLEDLVFDSESFMKFAMAYIEYNYEFDLQDWEDIRDAMLGDGWCLTDYGFRIWNDGRWSYEFDIPYELLLDHMKEEYLPTTWAAVLYFNRAMEGRARMDVNGDGLIDTVTEPVLEEDGILCSVNEAVNRLDSQWQGEPLEGLNFVSRFAWLERQEDGVTRLFWEVDIRGQGREEYTSLGRHVYVYRIEGENVVPEEDYEVAKD